MSKNIRYIFLLALTVLVVSCKKKTPENIGLPYLSSGDLLNAAFTDTFTLITHTCQGDSVQMNRATPNLLGAIRDPLFGNYAASIYAQYEPSKFGISFGLNPVIDSVVLSLPYYGTTKYYGSLIPQTFIVHEVTGTLSHDSGYYSNRSIEISATQAIGFATITPNVSDSVVVGTGKVPAQLRIPLNKDFFAKFLDTTLTTGVDYTNFSTFQTTLKGLKLSTTVPASGGAILYIDLTNALYSHLTFYYHNDLPVRRDTIFTFNVTTADCAHFSHIDHDYSTASDIKTQLSTDTTKQSDAVYVQGTGGVITRISFPYLNHFLDDGKKAINKAELVLKVDPATVSGYDPPAQLFATIDDPIGHLIMPDYYEGGAYFGGAYDATNHEYRFNISRYIQQVLNGTRKREGLFIQMPFAAAVTTANRVQLIGGNKALSGHMRLDVTYTPVK